MFLDDNAYALFIFAADDSFGKSTDAVPIYFTCTDYKVDCLTYNPKIRLHKLNNEYLLQMYSSDACLLIFKRATS